VIHPSIQPPLALLALATMLAACTSPGGASGLAGDAAQSDAWGDAATGSDAAPPGDTVGDRDQDGVPDDVDNCPDIFNPEQEDSNGNGIGDACDPDWPPAPGPPDRDGDGVPDYADPWPDDPSRPGIAMASTVYAHSATRLFRFGVKSYTMEEVGPFKWPADADSRQMTDLAIDRYGVMWAISFEDVFVCHPVTVQCWRLAGLPTQFNGLTLVPGSMIGAERDALIGVANDGGWWRLDLVGSNIQMVYLGRHGGTYTSSGDAFSMEGVGTFASVKRSGSSWDIIAEVDPNTGLVLREVMTLTGYRAIYGLAGWVGMVFAFDETGMVLIVDLHTGTVVHSFNGGHAWWGAGVRTRADPEDGGGLTP